METALYYNASGRSADRREFSPLDPAPDLPAGSFLIAPAAPARRQTPFFMNMIKKKIDKITPSGYTTD